MRLAFAPALALGLLVACSGGDGANGPSPDATATVTPDPTPREPAPAFDPGVTVEQAVQACREKNADRLRNFVAATVTDAEIEALFARGVDVRLLSRSILDGASDDAEVVVTLDIQREDETETVERTWPLERGADGIWRFVELPDCY